MKNMSHHIIRVAFSEGKGKNSSKEFSFSDVFLFSVAGRESNERSYLAAPFISLTRINRHLSSHILISKCM